MGWMCVAEDEACVCVRREEDRDGEKRRRLLAEKWEALP